jgi:hypothetical protein
MRDMNNLKESVLLLLGSLLIAVAGYKAGLRHAQEMAPAHPSPALKGN